MAENSNTDSKKCKGKAMLAYGILQLGSSVISAIALTAIALGFCSLKKEALVFNDCVQEVKAGGMKTSQAVRYCNGGS